MHHRVTPALVDFFHCFGVKLTGEDNPYHGTFYSTAGIPMPGLRLFVGGAVSIAFSNSSIYIGHKGMFGKKPDQVGPFPWQIEECSMKIFFVLPDDYRNQLYIFLCMPFILLPTSTHKAIRYLVMFLTCLPSHISSFSLIRSRCCSVPAANSQL